MWHGFGVWSFISQTADLLVCYCTAIIITRPENTHKTALVWAIKFCWCRSLEQNGLTGWRRQKDDNTSSNHLSQMRYAEGHLWCPPLKQIRQQKATPAAAPCQLNNRKLRWDRFTRQNTQCTCKTMHPTVSTDGLFMLYFFELGSSHMVWWPPACPIIVRFSLQASFGCTTVTLDIFEPITVQSGTTVLEPRPSISLLLFSQ